MGQTGRLKIYLLGPFKVEVGEQSIPSKKWKSKKALKLFKYLTANNGKKIKKDMLIDLLWPDGSASKASNLHTTIYNLRSTLDRFIKDESQSMIKYASGSYWFENSEKCWLDYREFEKRYQKGKELNESQPASALELFLSAESIYRDSFLADELYEDWALPLRQHYCELYLDLVLRISSLLVSLKQDYNQAIELCQQALNEDPFREEIHQAIISYLIKAGRYMEAAKKYRDYSKMLFEEFGLYPGSQMQELFKKVNIINNHEIKELDQILKGDEKEGPILCGSNTFEQIISLAVRRQNRTEESFTLMKINIKKFKDNNMRNLMEIIHKTLRKGDVITVWDDSYLLIKLFQADKKAGQIIKSRLEREINNSILGNMNIENYTINPARKEFVLKEII